MTPDRSMPRDVLAWEAQQAERYARPEPADPYGGPDRDDERDDE